jgi:hypothetical protein
MLIPLGILAGSGAGFESDYELISTTVLGTAASSVTFSSLGDYSSTYKHLQIRGVARTDRNDTLDNVLLRFNGDATALAYSLHNLLGNGSSVSSGGAAGQDRILVSYVPALTSTANTYAGFVTDIVDPYSTTKNTTVRSLGGQNDNNFRLIGLYSGAYYNTSAVSSITLTATTNYVAGSRFSLYGMKG